MKKSKFTETEIVKAINEHEAGVPLLIFNLIV